MFDNLLIKVKSDVQDSIFDEQFLINSVNIGMSNHQLYKQAGNAVSVNTVYAILYYLFVERKINQIK